MDRKTRQENDERIYREDKIDFNLEDGKGNAWAIYVTTAYAVELQECLDRLGLGFTVTAAHPEFLGFTVDEIIQNL